MMDTFVVRKVQSKIKHKESTVVAIVVRIKNHLENREYLKRDLGQVSQELHKKLR